jgi:predicted Rossmann fold flavoprotein
MDPFLGEGEMSEPRVLIIGGGAAGLSAAIASARLGVPVMLLEADARVGRKILASGNGRCNLTNVAVSPSAFNHPDFVEPLLTRYPCEAVRAFFAEMGLLTRVDGEGRVYPVTNFAGSALDVMRLECDRLGVDARCGFEASRLIAGSDTAGLEVFSADGESLRADAVVVTTGGGSSLLADSGHTMVETTPVLAPIRTETAPIRGLSGVRVRCAASLVAGVGGDRNPGDVFATERGELLFRDYGVSGIMIFDLSRYLEPEAVLSIDFFPDLAGPELEAAISRRCTALHYRTAETCFVGMLHDRVALAILRAAGVAADASIDELAASSVGALLKDFRLRVTGVADAGKAQVTRGGASVAQFDSSTMSSHCAERLYAAGEVLDIDGRSGGYNLHWAWVSGIASGEEAARAALARTGHVSSGGSTE